MFIGYARVNRISVTHPKYDTVSVAFDTNPLFESEPAEIIIRDAKPKEPVIREIVLRNNYDQYFELSPAHRNPSSSRKGLITLVDSGPAGDSWKLKLKITPPERQGDEKMFSDVFVVHVKGGLKLEVPCFGKY